MSASGVVILIAGLGLIGGFTLALAVGPAAPETRAGSLAFFASRLIAAAGVAVGALDVYSAAKTQQLASELLDGPVAHRLAEQLSAAFSDAGVLLLLACALAALGRLLPARD